MNYARETIDVDLKSLKESSWNIALEMRQDLEILKSSSSPKNSHYLNLRRLYVQFKTYLRCMFWDLDQRDWQRSRAYNRKYLEVLEQQVETERLRFFEELVRISTTIVGLLSQELTETFKKLMARHKRGREMHYSSRQNFSDAMSKLNDLQKMLTEGDMVNIFNQFWFEMEEIHDLMKTILRNENLSEPWTIVERYLEHTLTVHVYEDEDDEEEGDEGEDEEEEDELEEEDDDLEEEDDELEEEDEEGEEDYELEEEYEEESHVSQLFENLYAIIAERDKRKRLRQAAIPISRERLIRTTSPRHLSSQRESSNAADYLENISRRHEARQEAQEQLSRTRDQETFYNVLQETREYRSKSDRPGRPQRRPEATSRVLY